VIVYCLPDGDEEVNTLEQHVSLGYVR
jgi:hypothetical protein